MRILSTILCLLMIATVAKAEQSYADLVEELMPSVVNISTEKAVNKDDGIDNLMINPQLNGRESLGSGFFIRNDGHILTNFHVINGAKRITVTTNDGVTYDAKVKATDKTSDLAILKINGKKGHEKDFVPAKFGDADKVRIGDIVLTFGNPYGLGISVSQGIISAKSRSIGLGEQQYIQTDAAVNQGNSGGPMFDLNGEVIGVNSAIFTTQGANGVGFALPSNIATWVSNQLLKSGSVHRGWVGMNFANGVDKYTGEDGFVITDIEESSNAYREGLRVGDIITAYNDRKADDLNAFIQFVEQLDLGQALRLTVLSGGMETRNVIRVQEMPQKALKDVTNKALVENAKSLHQDEDKDVFYISELNIAVKEADPRGLKIIKLERVSPLYGKGIKEGDIILEADGEDIYNSDNLLDSIDNAMANDMRPITLLIQSLNDVFYTDIEVKLEND